MYNVVFSKSAKKDLKRVNSIYLVSVSSHIKQLSVDPRPFGCKKLEGYENKYRIRVGVYRVLYTIKGEILTVEVVKIRHRSSVYKGIAN
ncbi:hypothetical protein AGMMS49965_17990 [Bacteroidia bacterium]|nr:hypothetical protein AGMMS49965_17990 [Bacteroidia bacterium]